MTDKTKKIYVAGHLGMVGSAIFRHLSNNGYSNLVSRTHSQLDLTNQKKVQDFFASENLDEVYLAAAKVGGIKANNDFPADFIYQNLMIQSNVIDAAFRNNVKKILFLGSSCIYPKLAKQPMSEDALLTGILESTNEPYALAKIAGIKLCESYNRQHSQNGIDYRSIMPTNLYGPGDNYHSENSHVIPALIRRFHDAKINNYPKVDIWGSGSPRREFLYVDDLASASVHIMNLDKKTYNKFTQKMQSHINVGVGHDISIADLAFMIKKTVDYNGQIDFDLSKPEGPPQKLMDSSLINTLNWKAKVDLASGLKKTYNDYIMNYQNQG